MAKRFPIPEFDHDELKSLGWTAPELLDREAAARIVEAAGDGDTSAYGAYPVVASDAFLGSLSVRGGHCHALLCVMPSAGVRMTGRSYAWRIQRAIAATGVDGPAGRLLVDWKTPRPMNTRLGPEEGVASPRRGDVRGARAPVLGLLGRQSDHRRQRVEECVGERLPSAVVR